MRNLCKLVVNSVLVVSLAACQNATGPGGVTADNAEKFDAIGANETLKFTGTEPFWGGEVTGASLRFDTPEDPDGQVIAVERFAGLNGLGFSGRFNDNPFDLAVSPGDCSDGMSDRTYPFNVVVKIGDSTLNGCGWTDRTPFTGDENP